ncbi:hypothetical protein HDU97_006598 [Phlyctochytrium planicorne]|nr:hypothetical protein HDU97_006598 [Phlyctochytrium planicorne]
MDAIDIRLNRIPSFIFLGLSLGCIFFGLCKVGHLTAVLQYASFWPANGFAIGSSFLLTRRQNLFYIPFIPLFNVLQNVSRRRSWPYSCLLSLANGFQMVCVYFMLRFFATKRCLMDLANIRASVAIILASCLGSLMGSFLLTPIIIMKDPYPVDPPPTNHSDIDTTADNFGTQFLRNFVCYGLGYLAVIPFMLSLPMWKSTVRILREGKYRLCFTILSILCIVFLEVGLPYLPRDNVVLNPHTSVFISNIVSFPLVLLCGALASTMGFTTSTLVLSVSAVFGVLHPILTNPELDTASKVDRQAAVNSELFRFQVLLVVILISSLSFLVIDRAKREALESSMRANMQKSAFMAFLCHELRNPLHAILNVTDFVMDEDLEQMIQRDVYSDEGEGEDSGRGRKAACTVDADAVEVDYAGKHDTLHVNERSRKGYTLLPSPLPHPPSLPRDSPTADPATRRRDLMEAIRIAGTYMSQIINDVIDTTQFENGSVKLECREVDLGEVLGRVGRQVGEDLGTRGVEFLMEVGGKDKREEGVEKGKVSFSAFGGFVDVVRGRSRENVLEMDADALQYVRVSDLGREGIELEQRSHLKAKQEPHPPLSVTALCGTPTSNSSSTDIPPPISPTDPEPVLPAFQKPCIPTCNLPRGTKVWTDQMRLTQLLVNLLGHAMKVTPTGGKISLRVSLHPTRLKQRPAHQPSPGDKWHLQTLQMELTDSSSPPTSFRKMDLSDLFKPFDMTHCEVALQEYSGTGLGLAICKQIVEVMGGDVEAFLEGGGQSGGTGWWRWAQGDGEDERIAGMRFLVQVPVFVFVCEEGGGDVDKGRGEKEVNSKVEKGMALDLEMQRFDEHQGWLTVVDIAEEVAKESDAAASETVSQPIEELIEVKIDDVKPPPENSVVVSVEAATPVSTPSQLLDVASTDAIMETPKKERDGKPLLEQPLPTHIIAPSSPPLPRIDTTSSPVVAFPQPPPTSASTTSQSTSHDPAILIVDDSSINRKILFRLLRKSGWTSGPIIECVNGLEAVEAVQETVKMGRAVVGIFMDLQMPVMDGVEATRRIREVLLAGQNQVKELVGGEKKEVPIVAVTANHVEEGDLVGKLGFTALAPKPFLKKDAERILGEIMGVETGCCGGGG